MTEEEAKNFIWNSSGCSLTERIRAWMSLGALLSEGIKAESISIRIDERNKKIIVEPYSWAFEGDKKS